MGEWGHVPDDFLLSFVNGTGFFGVDVAPAGLHTTAKYNEQ
jgi:hypothetical protein